MERIFKVGDKVKVISLCYDYDEVAIGDVLTIKDTNIIRGDGRPNHFSKDLYSFEETKGMLYGHRLEFVEAAFTQKDLEVGMVVLKNKDLYFEIIEQHDVDVYGISDSINKIFKYDNEGNLIKIWERKIEKLYYLALPNSGTELQCYNLNLDSDNEIIFYFGRKDQTKSWKTKFTKKEISELPNQDLIACLEWVDEFKEAEKINE